MKTKAKLVLGLSLLTAATLTAGATGTFAWFTTNRKATATFNNITAKSVEGSLTIAMGTMTDGTVTTDGKLTGDSATTTATLSGATSTTTDVSSEDGVTFAHPNWTSTAGNTENDGVNGIKNVSDINTYGKKGYWTAYWVALQNNGGSAADVYLNKGSVVTAKDDKKEADKAAAKWTRVAINVAGTGGEPQSITKSGTKVIQGSDAQTNFVAPDASDATSKKYTAKPVTISALQNLADVVVATGNVSAQKLVKIPSNSKQYLTVSVWLEGTAATPQDAAIGGSVNVTLNFAALTAANA